MPEPGGSPLRIGLALTQPPPSFVLDFAARADEAGLYALWSTVGGTGPDTLTSFAVAAPSTRRILLGTSIVPAYPRHPIVLAAQALVFADLAPGRFRLGIGPSHRPVIEGVFGIPMQQPLQYMREYLTVVRGLLWEGRADFDGRYFQVHAALPEGVQPPRTPILLSALRPNAFTQAGEIADGAISWVCPLPYLVERALPAMRAGAERAGRERPLLVAHVLVALTTDRERAHEVGRSFLSRYARLPFYAGMFASAGFPIGDDGAVPDALVDELVIWGETSKIFERLRGILGSGPDELLVSLLPTGDPREMEREFLSALPSVSG